MKKLLLSAFVIAIFALYGYRQYHGDSKPVTVPTATNNTTTPAPAPSQTSTNNSGSMMNGGCCTTGKYKDGSYDGSVADAFYGYIQVRVIIQSGKLVDVQFLKYPNDHQNSVYINSQAMPMLKQEAITAQSGQVDIISGATATSQAFIESLTNALNQAV